MTSCQLRGDCECKSMLEEYSRKEHDALVKLDKVEGKNAQLTADYKALEEHVSRLMAENVRLTVDNERLTAELAGCRKDAERMAFVREHTKAIENYFGCEYQDINEAVDNAIARSKA